MLIRRALFSLVLIVAFCVFFLTNRDKEVSGVVFLGIGLGVLLIVIGNLLLAKVFFKRKMYSLHDTNLAYKKGWLVSHLTVVPFSRIQHIEIDEGPLERFFNLATLSIYTAGDSGKDLKISGLTKEKSQEIKELITAYIKDE
ncbi:MAG: PH domain-containing protein [Flavobacteriales bacterium]